MTDNRTFHFAVKPGCEPLQIESASAHDRLPFIAQGYVIYKTTWTESGKVQGLDIDFDKLDEQFDGDKEKAWDEYWIMLEKVSDFVESEKKKR